MQLPVQITIRDIPTSAALDDLIRKKAEKLDRFHPRITSCRVVVELSQKHKHQGKLYNVRIDTTVPGKELVVTRKENQDVYIALRDAFNALCRQLEDHSRKRNGHVKTHEETLYGRVIRVNGEEGYGFIEGTDGNEYYFSVTTSRYPRFEQLSVGDNVSFMPAIVNDGVQAHHVIKEKANHNGE